MGCEVGVQVSLPRVQQAADYTLTIFVPGVDEEEEEEEEEVNEERTLTIMTRDCSRLRLSPPKEWVEVYSEIEEWEQGGSRRARSPPPPPLPPRGPWTSTFRNR